VIHSKTISKAGAAVCSCGRQFYHDSPYAGLTKGRLDELRADPDATALPFAVHSLVLDGAIYVLDCPCWTVAKAGAQ